MLKTLLCSFLFLGGAHAECPRINDIPVMTEAGDAFYCAVSWYEKGGDIPLEGCNGGDFSWMDDTDFDAPPGEWMSTGSIIAKAGCTLYGYEVYDFNTF
jgi:hypothetical protein